MSVIEEIRNHFGEAVRKKCSEGRCHLVMEGLRNFVILKGEKVCQDQKISDCIIFVQEVNIIIGIIELKSKTIHADEIVEKLSNGLGAAWDILQTFNNRLKRQACLVVLAKGGGHISERRKLKRKSVKFQGKKHDIRLERCGVSFSQVIKTL